MKKEHIVIVILSIFLVFVSTAWVTSMLREKHWVVAGSWVGREPAVEYEYNMTTEQFSVNEEEWRIRWTCSNYNFPGSYWDIRVLNASSGSEINHILRHEKSGERNFSLKGTFYLKITIHGTLEDWRISAEVLR